uniref:Speckle targeted PIP5K1A-regulated poly(A) polymerase-like n=1 Tax=Crassostrea virginica TaxID=6565 RepID=A0A8B8CME0_CRAVI|nr:speckle targeted PIP5K1A-regulated poly(A) polymerase-like [Crassostrea virginica]
MAALMKRIWQFPVQYLYRPTDVFQLSQQVLPSFGRCCRAARYTQTQQISRTLSGSSQSPSDDQSAKQHPAKETKAKLSTTANLSTKATKKKKKKKKTSLPEYMNALQQCLETIRQASPPVQANVKGGLRTWVLDDSGDWIRRQEPSSGNATQEQKDHPDLVNKGPTWFIEDVYKSKEYQEKINHAERSLLIQCNSNMIQQGIAVCERMGPVSKVLMISNRTILVTFAEEISHVLDGAYKRCQSKAVSIQRMENRVFEIKISKKHEAHERLKPECQNIQQTLQVPAPKLKNKSIDQQITILGQRALCQGDYQAVMLFLRQCIQDIVDMAAPDHQVVPFGSVLNGFISDNSDLDTMVLSTIGNGDIADGRPLLKQIEQIMKRLKHYNSILPLLHTRVPIVQYHNKLLGIRGDISYSTSGSSGKIATIYMKAISEFSPSVVPFIMTIKRWTKIYASWYPSKFVFIAMALFYLQRCKVIPPIEELKIVDDSSLSADRKWACSQSESPSVLLYGFFQFYKDFDFQSYDICLTSGQIIPKRQPGSTTLVNPFSTVEKSKEHLISEIRENSMERIQALMEESLWILSSSPASLLLPQKPR